VHGAAAVLEHEILADLLADLLEHDAPAISWRCRR
jgi:hypothetical protein